MNSLLTGETSKRFYIGAGQQISEADIVRLARANGIPPYLALACAYKETADLEGSYSSGALNALYEDHVAYRNTNGAIRQRLTDNKLAAKGWRDLPYPSSPYPAIDKCVAIAGVEVAALSSSWGMYQLLGENYAMLGFETAADMVAWLAISEINQFLGWIKFIDATNIRHKLIAEDWDGYSLAYNGKAYKSHNYHKKLQALAVKFALKYGKEVGGETPPAPQAATASLPAIEPHKFNIDVDAIKKLAAELKTVGVTINVNINVSYPAENFINPQK